MREGEGKQKRKTLRSNRAKDVTELVQKGHTETSNMSRGGEREHKNIRGEKKGKKIDFWKTFKCDAVHPKYIDHEDT